MGNRACVVFVNENHKGISPAVYLHWNGGPESVYAFLAELERRKVVGSADYAAARFIHIVGDYFDFDSGAGCMSLGVMNGPDEITLETLAPLAHTADDNGVFVVYLGAKDKRKIRRFVVAGYESPPREMCEKEVARERKKACESEYHLAIVRELKELRPKIADIG